MKKFFILGVNIFFTSLSILAQQSTRTSYAISIKEADSLFMASDYSSARRAYETLIGTDEFKNSAMEWNRLAICCQALADFKKAVEYYNKSLQLNPSSPLDQQILYRLSKTYMSTRDENNAMNNLQQAVEK